MHDPQETRTGFSARPCLEIAGPGERVAPVPFSDAGTPLGSPNPGFKAFVRRPAAKEEEMAGEPARLRRRPPGLPASLFLLFTAVADPVRSCA